MKINWVALAFLIFGVVFITLICSMGLLTKPNGLLVISIGLLIVSVFSIGITLLYRYFGPNPSALQTSSFLATIMSLLIIFGSLISQTLGVDISWDKSIYVAIGTWITTFLFGIFYSFLRKLTIQK